MKAEVKINISFDDYELGESELSEVEANLVKDLTDFIENSEYLEYITSYKIRLTDESC